VPATSGFRLVAAMNPFDAIGTARISSAVYDRVCRLAVGYQTAGDEAEIVLAAGVAGETPPDEAWLAKVVEVVRRTREHPEVRIGSSVRGAIDTAAVARSLADLRGVAPTDRGVGLDAAVVALAGRLRLREGSVRKPEDIVTEIWRDVFGRDDEPEDADGPGKATAPTGADRT
jgi:MoxR-like ATPase